MTDAQEQSILFTRTTTSRNITVAEWECLDDMFNSEGWRVYMDLRSRDAIASAQGGLNSKNTENERLRSTIAYETITDDLMFCERMRKAVANQPDHEDIEAEQLLDDEETKFLKRGLIPPLSQKA